MAQRHLEWHKPFYIVFDFMLNLSPFSALRPKPQQAKFWTNRQIDTYNTLENDRLDFVSLIRPDENKHKNIRKRLTKFLHQQLLVKDPTPSLYCYRIVEKETVLEGIIGLLDTHHVLDGAVVPHEDVVSDRVKMFKSYLDQVMINTEPVLMGHSDSEALAELKTRFFRSEPFVKFDREGISHSLWRIDHPTLIHQVNRAIKDLKSLLIIDGHHRCFSSVQLAAEQKKYNKMLVCLVPEHQLKIGAFCRLFKDLNNLRPDHFLAQLSSKFDVTRVNYYSKPHGSRFLNLYLEKSWYKLRLSNADMSKISNQLPTQVIFSKIAQPLLGIDDLRNEARIEYQYHQNTQKGIEAAVDSKKFTCGIEHFPISLDTVKNYLSDSGLLPPKSTYVLPKLLNGLLIYDFKDV